MAKLEALLRDLPGKPGDVVFSTLVSLGVATGQRPVLLKELHRRVGERLNNSLFFVLSQLADESTLTLLTATHPPIPVQEASDGDLYSLAGILALVADRAGAGPVCDRVVEALEKLYQAKPQALAGAIFLNSGILPRCDSRKTARFVATLLAEEDDTEEKTTHAFWLLDHRLSGCVRPAQQEGFAEGLSEAAMSLLGARVLKAGTDTSRGLTFEGDSKRCAVDTALTFGAHTALGWLDAILATEANPYLRHQLLETYSAFRIEPLPAAVRKWITEEIDVKGPDSDPEWILRTAASRLARSAATAEAFEVLLHPGLTVDGQVMRSTIEALTEVALMLAPAAGESSDRVAGRLLRVLTPVVSDPQASAACGALGHLAARGRLAGTFLNAVFANAKDRKLRL